MMAFLDYQEHLHVSDYVPAELNLVFSKNLFKLPKQDTSAYQLRCQLDNEP